MTVDFCDHFWGDKNNGFDILYHNMKYGQVASKELAEFIRERSSLEENHSKLLTKLAKQAGNGCTNGTFAPLWQVLKISSEKLATLHMQMVMRFQELVKDVYKYCDEQHRKHKNIKDEESGTLEIVQAIQSTTITILKAKEIYTQRCIEFEKLKRENASPREIEKAEVKYKKAGDEYKSLVERYKTVRDEFQTKMTISCQHFQNIEEDHLKQMKAFLDSYARVLETGHDLIGQVQMEFRQQCVDMTVEKMLEQFVKAKTTGTERPIPIEFEEADLSCLINLQSPDRIERTSNGDKASKKEGNKQCSAGRKSKPSRRTTSLLNLFLPSHGHSHDSECSNSTVPTSPTSTSSSERENTTTNGSNNDPSLTRNTFRGSKWFLKSRRDKKKEKKKKKKGEINKEEKCDGEERDEKEDPETSITGVAEVDEEGFTIRPEVEYKDNKSSIGSSSESESDDDKERRIHIEIKPLSNGSAPLSASIDELRASVGGLTLTSLSCCQTNRRTPPTDSDSSAMKRSLSLSQQFGKPSNDLLGLSLQSPIPSSASTPTGGYGDTFMSSLPNTTLQSPVSPGHRSTETTPTPTKYEELGDLFSELGDLPPALPPKHSHNNSRVGTPVGPLMLPRPPSRKALEGPLSRGRVSPVSPMSRADSISSLTNEFRASSMSVGSSRGPSPLTIGMSDTVPLAVAFQEIVHAYFKGTDESRCQVKLTGDMMLSFPAGIVQVLTNNPSPATLSFRIKNTQKLENVLPNKQLISQESLQGTGDNHIYEFNMVALTALLRRQAEQNPSASYFNVDILKYQIKVSPGAQSTPLQLVAYWKCDQQNTDLRVDYKYNSAAMTAAFPLLNISILVPVDGEVSAMQSKPSGTWISETQRAVWKFTELSQHSDNNGVGSLRARFELNSGPSSPSTIAAQFSCEGTTLSGADFELVGVGYRVSLVKRRFITGKYICEAEPDMKYRYAPPPV